MDRDRIRRQVIDAIRDVQEQSGRACEPLQGADRPIGTLDGFDSLNALEVTVELEHRFSLQVDGKNLLVSDDGQHALSIDEVTARIVKLLSVPKQKEATDAVG